jgi:hypothetical protein
MIDEAALDAAIVKQCAVTFTGEHAICICKVRGGDTTVCRFAKDRLRQVIETYLTTVAKVKTDQKSNMKQES